MTGTAEEMVCPGGEAAFVGAMVADSLQLRDRIHWWALVAASLTYAVADLTSCAVQWRPCDGEPASQYAVLKFALL